MAELVPIPFERLLRRVFHEYTRNDAIFDLPSKKFHRPDGALDLSVTFCGNRAANPIGPAAGPQTQLAQNIVLSWLAGARIIELKTVQIKDRLHLTRPCIDMATVGYNTEWSQELKLGESLREYVKAAMIVEILTHWSVLWGSRSEKQQQHAKPSTAGYETIFDISIGYDLAGIQSKEIRQWLNTMRNASALVEEYRKEIPSEFAAYKELPFQAEIGNSITLSTFHGTPAGEIEKICEFLLSEMDFHVIIKMNPPMLGRERIEYLLHDRLGYRDIEVNETVYDVNITFADAVEVVRRLQAVASRHGKTIGVKFGNTLEVMNKGHYLKERVQYLSGRPLHVLHLALVEEWRNVFGAAFPISFSAGVDANNVADCVALGLVPVTTCTDLLRPGGYGRLWQYLYNLEWRMKESGSSGIADFIVRMSYEHAEAETADRPRRSPQKVEQTDLETAIISNTSSLLKKSINSSHLHYEQNKKPPRKIGSTLHLWDCINCDKCIPVCPNDAIFSFEVEPGEIQYDNFEIDNGSWSRVSGGVFKIGDTHQIASYADACNECGNCDVFCPEDGGPHLKKPRFFGSMESYLRWRPLDGFFLTVEGSKPVLYGRCEGEECSLIDEGVQNVMTWVSGNVVCRIDKSTNRILEVKPDARSSGRVMDMKQFLIMKTLLQSMTNARRVNFVNAGINF